MGAALRTPSVREVTVYECSTCLVRYGAREEAEACASQPIQKPLFHTGDIVTYVYGYSWFDGDKRWIVNPELLLKRDWEKRRYKCRKSGGNCFDPCCTLGFYYVVTAVDEDPQNQHRIRYHLFTKAMSGDNGYRGAFIYQDFISLKKVRNPSRSLVRDSMDLIGKKAGHLF